MSETETVARRWFEEVWNDRRVETIDELLTPQSVCYSEDGPITGPDEFRARFYEPFAAAFPALRIVVEDVLVNGEQAVVRWSATAAHTGAGLGFAPSGHEVTFGGMTWLCVRGGRMMEGWQSSNIPQVVQALAAASAGTSA